MPESLAETKSISKQREQTDDSGGYKHGRGGSDAKHGPCGDPPWNADTKEGKGRGRVLSSLAKPSSPRPNEMPAFSSLPSPAADSGKLAPLDIGQRSPRSQASARSSIRSNSPQNLRDQTLEAKRTSLSLSPSGSGSPRSTSPRLPPMKSTPSPPPSHDDASLPGLGLSPTTRAQSARRVRSLPPNSKRASCADPANSGTSLEFPGGRGDSGSDGRFSPLLDVKEKHKEPRWENSSPAVDHGGRRRGRGGDGGERGRTGSVGIEVAEAKHGPNEGSQDRLPGTKGEGRRRSSTHSSPNSEGVERASRPGTERLAPAAGGKTTMSLSNGNGNTTGNGGSLPVCGDRAGEHRDSHRSEEKEVGSMPNSPTTARGEESFSPRTRRMRPQRDSTA